jgi:hypothetical protein
MKAHEVYRQIREKAEEVKEAIHAILAIRGDKSRWTADDLIDLLSRNSGLLAVEADIERDNRRHVKVLYKDYCALRDELIALLTAGSSSSTLGFDGIVSEMITDTPLCVGLRW